LLKIFIDPLKCISHFTIEDFTYMIVIVPIGVLLEVGFVAIVDGNVTVVVSDVALVVIVVIQVTDDAITLNVTQYC
jgi:hypothetical protein